MHYFLDFLVTKALEEDYVNFEGLALKVNIRYLSDWDGTDTWEEYYVEHDGETAKLWDDVEGFFLQDLKGDEREFYKMLYPLANFGREND